MRLNNIAKGDALHKVENLQTTRGKIRNQACAGNTRSRVTRTPLAKGGGVVVERGRSDLERIRPLPCQGNVVVFCKAVAKVTL